MAKRLNDAEAYERLNIALVALGAEEAETAYAQTALEAARRVTNIMQLVILAEMDKTDVEALPD